LPLLGRVERLGAGSSLPHCPRFPPLQASSLSTSMIVAEANRVFGQLSTLLHVNNS
jgi:hypothetical protein